MYIQMLLENGIKSNTWEGLGLQLGITRKNEVRFQSMDEITKESKIKLLSPRVDKAERGGGNEDEEDKYAEIGKFKTVVVIQ